jgi:anti-sigma B factor antagonist
MYYNKGGEPQVNGTVESQIDGPIMKITIAGEFSITLAPEVRGIIKKGLDGGIAQMIIDLKRVDYIDSSGIGTLVMALKGVNRVGGELKVIGVPEQVKKLLNFPPFNGTEAITAEASCD